MHLPFLYKQSTILLQDVLSSYTPFWMCTSEAPFPCPWGYTASYCRHHKGLGLVVGKRPIAHILVISQSVCGIYKGNWGTTQGLSRWVSHYFKIYCQTAKETPQVPLESIQLGLKHNLLLVWVKSSAWNVIKGFKYFHFLFSLLWASWWDASFGGATP